MYANPLPLVCLVLVTFACIVCLYCQKNKNFFAFYVVFYRSLKKAGATRI